MWETALAFVVWGCYGSVLTAARIDPAITAISRTVAVGGILTLFVRSPVPWRSGALWLSGSVLLIDELLYVVSAVSGPVAIIGLAYGCVPVVVPVISSFLQTDARPLNWPRWLYLGLAFLGNLLIFRELRAAQIAFSTAAVFAAFAALLFCIMPLASARLQQQGLTPWALLKGQGIVGAILAVPLIVVLRGLGIFGSADAATFARSAALGGVNSVAFTMVPFYFWYRGIARAGVSRTAVCCFAEPLVATVFSLFIVKDAPPTPVLLAGAGLVLAGIALSARGEP
jgi:drug/metabolite transporter (DMT)-like permease